MQDQAIFSDEVVSIRPVRKEDEAPWLDMIHETLADLRPWMSFAQQPPTRQDVHEWLQAQPKSWENGTNYAFAIQEVPTGGLLGSCILNQIDPHNRLANMVYWVRSSRRGQGIAGRAARLLAEFGFRRLQLLRIEIVVAEQNTASLRVAEKTGAKREGLLRNRILVGEKVFNAVMHSLIPEDLL
jgi:ribosomal-protein-serine acetyltransferase